MTQDDELKKQVSLRARRMKKKEEDRPTLLAQTRYLGTVGLLLTLPIIAGAYLGLWFDQGRAGYSIAGTLGGLVVGVMIGGLNVYLYVKGTI